MPEKKKLTMEVAPRIPAVPAIPCKTFLIIPPSPCALPKAITPNSITNAKHNNAFTQPAEIKSRIFCPALSRTAILSDAAKIFVVDTKKRIPKTVNVLIVFLLL